MERLILSFSSIYSAEISLEFNFCHSGFFTFAIQSIEKRIQKAASRAREITCEIFTEIKYIIVSMNLQNLYFIALVYKSPIINKISILAKDNSKLRKKKSIEKKSSAQRR